MSEPGTPLRGRTGRPSSPYELHFGQHRISLLSPDEAVDWVLNSVDRASGPCQQVMASGFHGMSSVTQSASISRELSDVDLWLPDGIAPVAMARVLGAREVSRVPGPELFSALLRAGQSRERPLRHFLFGDTPDTLARLREHIEANYPGNIVCGAISPPFGSAPERMSVADEARINGSEADIIWVGLGTPKQDLWIARNKPFLRVPVAIAVGAAFRFEVGLVERAPRWVGRAGLEWAFRFSREPRKLWRRVLLDGPVFVLWAVTALLTGRVRLAAPADNAQGESK